ncbi:hypothetical protein KC19_8G060000 [Ceratodon purpureus]|uniref:Uncharacterized protein n=1 Tax=Ceratodon purpureus TaxID=3225 RepID=A0A8T0GVN2_CERPU|nr:hypothetical protein KC19_8G060000 [Ceratodon purpureus]
MPLLLHTFAIQTVSLNLLFQTQSLVRCFHQFLATCFSGTPWLLVRASPVRPEP